MAKLLRTGPTPGSAWRAPREAGYEKMLPSGKVARLRPVSPDQLIASGDVPDILTPLVLRMLYHGSDGSELTQLVTSSEESVAHARGTITLINAVCRAAFIQPRITEAPQSDDEITIDDVEVLDRYFVFQLATQPAEVLRDFRLSPATTDVATVPDEQGDGQPAQRHDDDSGSLGGADVRSGGDDVRPGD